MIAWLIFVRSNEQYQKTFELFRYDANFSTGTSYVIKSPIKLKNGRIIKGKDQNLLALNFYGHYGEDIDDFLNKKIVDPEEVIFLSDLDEKELKISYMKEEDLLAYLKKINFVFEDGSFPTKLPLYNHSLRREKKRKKLSEYFTWVYIIESRDSYYKYYDFWKEEIFFYKRGFFDGHLILLEGKLELKDGNTIGSTGEKKVLITFRTESKEFIDNMVKKGILNPECLINAEKIKEEEFDTKSPSNFLKKGKTMKGSTDLTLLLYEQNFRFQDNSRFHWPIQKKNRKDMKEKDYEKLILDGIKNKIEFNEEIADDLHISNHNLCDICGSYEHNMRYYKKEEGKWKEVEWNRAEEEADIALAFCYKCNNPERVHEEDCQNEAYENRLLPWVYQIWDWKEGSLIMNNKKICNELFGLRNIGHTFITYYSKIIVGLFTFLDTHQDEKLEALFTDTTSLYSALSSWVFGEKSPEIVYPYLVTFLTNAKKIENKDFSSFLEYVLWISEDLKNILKEHKMDNEDFFDAFTLIEERADSGALILLWRLGYFLGRIMDISQSEEVPILLDSFKAIQALCDALGDWVFGKGILHKIKVRFKTFDHALQFEQDPAYHGIFEEVKITRDNIESFIKDL